MQQIDQVMPKVIRDLKACVAQKPTTPPPPPVKREFLDKWLRLTITHPKLKLLEDAVGSFCRGVWNSPGAGHLLVLFGDNGTGKTHSAKSVARWIAAVGASKQWVERANEIRTLQALFWEWPKLLDALKRGQWDLVDDCETTPCLIIDELGGGHDPSCVGVDKLCQILSRREKRWTLVTTNIKPEAWEEKFDCRIASRLLRNSTIIDLTDVPDYSTVKP